MAEFIILDLPPWPHVQGPKARVQVSDKKFLFGHRVGKEFLLTFDNKVVQSSPENFKEA